MGVSYLEEVIVPNVSSWGFMIFFVSSILYFVTQRPILKTIFLFLSGLGLGMINGVFLGDMFYHS